MVDRGAQRPRVYAREVKTCNRLHKVFTVSRAHEACLLMLAFPWRGLLQVPC